MSKDRIIEKDLRIYSQNIQWINDPYKLDCLLELLDQHQVDIVFLQETFRGVEQKQDDSIIYISTREDYALYEYKNENSRRGIQFWVSKDLEEIINKD